MQRQQAAQPSFDYRPLGGKSAGGKCVLHQSVVDDDIGAHVYRLALRCVSVKGFASGAVFPRAWWPPSWAALRPLWRARPRQSSTRSGRLLLLAGPLGCGRGRRGRRHVHGKSDPFFDGPAGIFPLFLPRQRLPERPITDLASTTPPRKGAGQGTFAPLARSVGWNG